MNVGTGKGVMEFARRKLPELLTAGSSRATVFQDLAKAWDAQLELEAVREKALAEQRRLADAARAPKVEAAKAARAAKAEESRG